ncbi:acyltransferase family protein [Hymenobacter sp. PAMC 26628]|uniref:acyltransferase family protein n=1 Tax=Hymenobacter sp. PAMC 26628 TaxID=1484118 RepID=UPI0009020506|nr:acyltransferase [Hymenobacter sp. PAMC 26628]
MQEIRALTGLRFLAALYVFIFHLHERHFFNWLPWYAKNIVEEGALGVNVFFVLSGILLTYSHLKDYDVPVFKGYTYFSTFLFKRFARIYPVLFIGILASLIISIFLGKFSSATLLIAFSEFTLTNAWFPKYTLNWLGGTWSLSAEMFFYLSFPFLLPVLLQIRRKNILFIILISAIILATLPGLYYSSMARNIQFDKMLYGFFYLFPPARIPEFICGCITAILIFRHGCRVPTWMAATASIAGLLYLIKFGPSLLGHVGHNRFVLPVIILIVGHLTQSNLSLFFRWLTLDSIVYLGRISYGFYIWQTVALELPDTVWTNNYFHLHKMPIALLIFSATIIAAIISYHLIEKPSHKVLLTMLRARHTMHSTKKLYSLKQKKIKT